MLGFLVGADPSEEEVLLFDEAGGFECRDDAVVGIEGHVLVDSSVEVTGGDLFEFTDGFGDSDGSGELGFGLDGSAHVATTVQG